MTTDFSVRPNDILADEADTIQKNGMTLRKGTVAAFLANIELLESNDTSEEEKVSIIQTLHELAPAMIAIGFHKHVVFKNPIVAKIIFNAIVQP